MKYLSKHILVADTILEQYNMQEPFPIFLKKYFRQHKKHGSKDRYQISNICYGFFRLAHVLTGYSLREIYDTVCFLMDSSPFHTTTKDQLPMAGMECNTVAERVRLFQAIEPRFLVEKMFPLSDQVGKLQDTPTFFLSHLCRPNVFIRSRPNCEQKITDQLLDLKTPFEKLSGSCFSFQHGISLEEMPGINKTFVIQDYASQQTGLWLTKAKNYLSAGRLQVWDCCAASGGKSILAADYIQNMELTASDLRDGILKNLSWRLKKAEIPHYRTQKIDLIKPVEGQVGWQKECFDLIICDAPCSGSGTWSRQPEWLSYFDINQLTGYNEKQRTILGNALPYLKTNGIILYITCSVYWKENEGMVEFLEKTHQLKVVEASYIEGGMRKADTMFCAILRK
jgi:16S rRNA (cytosine967-C5)-methyltransferase